MIKNIILDVGGVFFDDSKENIRKLLNTDRDDFYKQAYGAGFNKCLVGESTIPEVINNLRTNEKALNLIKKFVELDKWVFAICDGPNAIYENHILDDKSYSSFPIENINNIGSQKRTKEYINVDGKYITGKCPSAAIDLGIKVIEILYGKELANKAYYGLYGLEK